MRHCVLYADASFHSRTDCYALFPWRSSVPVTVRRTALRACRGLGHQALKSATRRKNGDLWKKKQILEHRSLESTAKNASVTPVSRRPPTFLSLSTKSSPSRRQTKVPTCPDFRPVVEGHGLVRQAFMITPAKWFTASNGGAIAIT